MNASAMDAWQAMDSAPEDGSWITGRNAEGREARIQSRPIHPRVPDLRHWCEGDEREEGSWIKSACFYPVEWRP